MIVALDMENSPDFVLLFAAKAVGGFSVVFADFDVQNDSCYDSKGT